MNRQTKISLLFPANKVLSTNEVSKVIKMTQELFLNSKQKNLS